jgi:ADP-ribosylglycohydrolase
MADVEVLRRAHGTLLAAFGAESLGSLVEFGGTDAVKATYPNGVRDLADGGSWNTLAGQPTDDGEEALMLARTLIKEGSYDPAAALDAYVHWFRSGPFDCGTTTSAALGAAARGKTRSECLELAAGSARASSQANGSLMRAAPLGIHGWRDPRNAADLARQDSALTHPHPTCVESCAAYVAAISTAIGKKAGARETYEAALAEARRGANTAVIDALLAAETAPPARFDGPDAGWVLVALQNAFYRLTHSPSLEGGVVETVSQGGDADTTGIVVGALLGAVHGRDAVPARWRRLVMSCRPTREAGAVHPRPREYWPIDALELAERLLLAGS